MDADHAQRREPLGAGGADVILAQHLQHRRARHPRHHRQRIGAQHDGWQDQVLRGGPEGALVAREQRIDQQEPGGRLDVVLHRDPARHRRQPELDREQQDQQQAPPEDRHRVAGERGRHHAVVEHRIAAHRRDDARRNAQQQREDDCAERQFDGGGEQREELAQHGFLRDQRFAQVAMQHPPDVDTVLHQHGPVQAVFLEQLRVPRGVDAALAGQRLDRVAGHQPDQEERQQRHPDEGRDDQRQARENETKHGKDKARKKRALFTSCPAVRAAGSCRPVSWAGRPGIRSRAVACSL